MQRVVKYCLFTLVILTGGLFAQETKSDGYTVFYHENGKISSEGIMRDGNPDGYWKTYYEDGILKSEGNRKNFELDSIWKFYSSDGRLIIELTYKNNKKNGIKKLYFKNETVEENFVNDIKQGEAKYFNKNGRLIRIINFVDGLEHGMGKEFDDKGNIITLLEYKNGYILSREEINRFDTESKMHGKWKYFHKNGVLKTEVTYWHGKKNGYLKEYDDKGNLLYVKKYIDDVEQIDVPEIVKHEIKKDYYSTGQVRVSGSYRDGKPDGVRREYKPDGKVEKAYIFKKGVMLSQGVLEETGIKEGYWMEYFETGELMAEGNYKNSVRTGDWKFYHRNRKLEQEGTYNSRGQVDGPWKWYYESGSLQREENFFDGIQEGTMTEYCDTTGKIIIKGEYLDGQEEGLWFYEYGDAREEGNYLAGNRNGLWKTYFSNGKTAFEGRYIDDIPSGKFAYYWGNGNLKEKGNYVAGKREGDWRYFNENGTLFLVVYYKNGIEKRYDNVKVKPVVSVTD